MGRTRTDAPERLKDHRATHTLPILPGRNSTPAGSGLQTTTNCLGSRRSDNSSNSPAAEFRPTENFFFSWGETRRVSPHALAASRLRIASWRVAVGRNRLSFAQGVGQNCLQGGAKLIKPRAAYAVPLASPMPYQSIRDCDTKLSNQHQLALKLKMLGRRTEPSIRKARHNKHWQSQWRPAGVGRFAQALRFAAVIGVQYSWVWVVGI